MGCYVDVMRHYPDAGLRFTDFCHLLADTREELHELADRLGMQRRFFQDHPWRWHYDLPSHLRAQAVQRGVTELTTRQVAELLRKRRAALAATAAPAQASRVTSTTTSSSAAPDEPAIRPLIGGTSP
jgi:hypothetical protein